MCCNMRLILDGRLLAVAEIKNIHGAVRGSIMATYCPTII